MKTNEHPFQKIQKILDALVINDRYHLIMCIKKYNENTLSENEIFNFSFQSKKQLREKLKNFLEDLKFFLRIYCFSFFICQNQVVKNKNKQWKMLKMNEVWLIVTDFLGRLIGKNKSRKSYVKTSEFEQAKKHG